MHLEMQIESHKLLALLRQRFLQQRICVTDPITVELESGKPPQIKTIIYYFDHLTISNKTHFRRVQVNDIVVYDVHHVQGYKLQLVQPISVFVATLEELQVADDEPANYQEVDFDVIFDVFMVQDKDGWALQVAFADLVSSVGLPIPDSVKQVVKQNLAGQTKPTPFDLSPLKGLTGKDFVVAESFVGCDSEITRIAIRFEQQTGGVLEGAAAWEQFLTGQVNNNLAIQWITTLPGSVELGPTGHPIHVGPAQKVLHSLSGDWSLYLDFGLVEPAFHNAIDPGIARQTDEFLVDPNSIEVTWAPIDFEAVVLAKFSGSAHTPPWGLDVGVDVTLSIALGVDAGGQLTSGGRLDYHVQEGDEVLVSLTSGGIGLIGGMIIGAFFGGPPGAAIGGVIGFVVGVAGTIIAFAAYTPSLSPPNCAVSDDGKSFSCMQELPLPTNPLMGKLTVDTVVGLSGGLLFLGKLAPASDLKQAKITDVGVSDWVWNYQDACGSPSIGVGAFIDIFGSGMPPLHMCNWSIPKGTDPEQILSGGVEVKEYPGVSASSIQVGISPLNVPDQYWQNPSPFQLLLQTSAGVRLITLPPIPQLTDAQGRSLEIQLLEARANCEQAADAFWSATHRFNPKWSVDPGPGGEIGARWWGVAARGLASGERLEIEDRAGVLLAQATPDQAGFARADALTDPGTDVSVVRASAGGGAVAMRSMPSSALSGIATSAVSRVARRVVVSETVLTRAARIELRAPCRAVEAGMLDGVPVVFCITEIGTHELYELSDPCRPALRRRVVVAGLRGVVPWGEYWLLWGAEGLRLVGSGRTCLPLPPSLPRGAIASVVADKHLILQQEDGTVMAFDERLRQVTADLKPCPRSSWPMSGWLAQAVRVGRTLVRRDGSAVEIWRIGRSAVHG